MIKAVMFDDRDGTSAEEDDTVDTRQFALDGVDYEIHLTHENYTKLMDGLGEFLPHARKVGARRGRPRTSVSPVTTAVAAPTAPRARMDRAQSQAIRDWARTHGYRVSNRGRVPDEVQTAFHAGDVDRLQELARVKGHLSEEQPTPVAEEVAVPV